MADGSGCSGIFWTAGGWVLWSILLVTATASGSDAGTPLVPGRGVFPGEIGAVAAPVASSGDDVTSQAAAAHTPAE